MRKINYSILSDTDLELVSGGRARPSVAMRGGGSQNSGDIQQMIATGVDDLVLWGCLPSSWRAAPADAVSSPCHALS